MYVNEKYDCPYVFVCGDLNSRTADRNYYCNNDVPDENSDSESEGGGLNSKHFWGRTAWHVLHSQNANFERGFCDGDREGELTFVSHSGSSVNDYFLVSLDFPESNIVQADVSPRVESQHMPVSLTLNTARQHGARATADQTTTIFVTGKTTWHEHSKTMSGQVCLQNTLGRGDWRDCT